MKKGFEKYLETIGITTVPKKSRIDYFIKLCIQSCKEEPIDIFVDDYITKGGERKYTDLTLFSNNYIFSAKNFLKEEEFIILRFSSLIYYCKFNIKEYNFKKATEDSRLSIYLLHDSEVKGNYKASKENCDYLRDIYFKYLLPRIK